MEERSMTTIEKSVLKNEVIEALKTVYDPEIPVNVYDLGLIYEVDVDDDRNAHVVMTLTTPMCPVAESLPAEVADAVRNLASVKDVKVDLTWDPPFSLDRMPDEVKLMLGLL
jgi:FeS assembly SUF system protein